MNRVRELLRHAAAHLLAITISAYAIIFLFHSWLGLPVSKLYTWLALYVVLAWIFIESRRLWKYLPLPLLIVYWLVPFPATLGLGLVTFANTHVSTPTAEAFQQVSQASLNPLFVQISDSHFLGANVRTTKDGEHRNDQTFVQLVAQIVRLHPRYLLITGDVTDSGREAEWKQADEILLKPVREAGIKIIMAPGNHDLQPALQAVSHVGPPEGAILIRRFLEKQVEADEDLTTVDRGSLKPLVEWRPTADQVATTERNSYLTCMANYPAEPNGSRAGWAKGCELATRPQVIAEGLIESYVAQACADWFPLLHNDNGARISTIVMCSTGPATANIGYNAVGSFGDDQLKRLRKILDDVPAETQFVFIMLHHPIARRWEDTYSIPHEWWRWEAWENSSLYNYALAYADWRQANDVVDIILGASNRLPQTSFVFLYGHRHQPSLSAIRTEHSVLALLEAPAFGADNYKGFRACYLGTSANQLACKWLQP